MPRLGCRVSRACSLRRSDSRVVWAVVGSVGTSAGDEFAHDVYSSDAYRMRKLRKRERGEWSEAQRLDVWLLALLDWLMGGVLWAQSLDWVTALVTFTQRDLPPAHVLHHPNQAHRKVRASGGDDWALRLPGVFSLRSGIATAFRGLPLAAVAFVEIGTSGERGENVHGHSLVRGPADLLGVLRQRAMEAMGFCDVGTLHPAGTDEALPAAAYSAKYTAKTAELEANGGTRSWRLAGGLTLPLGHKRADLLEFDWVR